MANVIPAVPIVDPETVTWKCEGCSKAMPPDPVYGKVVKDKPVPIENWTPKKSWDVSVPGADGKPIVYKTCGQECGRNVYLVRGMDEAFKRLLTSRKL
jgi:hypothetical protein